MTASVADQVETDERSQGDSIKHPEDHSAMLAARDVIRGVAWQRSGRQGITQQGWLAV